MYSLFCIFNCLSIFKGFLEIAISHHKNTVLVLKMFHDALSIFSGNNFCSVRNTIMQSADQFLGVAKMHKSWRYTVRPSFAFQSAQTHSHGHESRRHSYVQ